MSYYITENPLIDCFRTINIICLYILVPWILLKIINEQNIRVLEKLRNSNTSSRVWKSFQTSIERYSKNIV